MEVEEVVTNQIQAQGPIFIIGGSNQISANQRESIQISGGTNNIVMNNNYTVPPAPVETPQLAPPLPDLVNTRGEGSTRDGADGAGATDDKEKKRLKLSEWPNSFRQLAKENVLYLSQDGKCSVCLICTKKESHKIDGKFVAGTIVKSDVDYGTEKMNRHLTNETHLTLLKVFSNPNRSLTSFFKKIT